MKKLIFTIFFTALLASCDTSTTDSGGDALPRGVYIAGYNNNSGIKRACYWTGGRRVDLNGYFIDGITVLDGKTLITGNFLTPLAEDDNYLIYIVINGYKYDGNPCYWVDGKRHVPEKGQTIFINDGKVFFVNQSEYFRNDFSPSAVTVSGGVVYVAGTYNNYSNYPGYRSLCYYVGDVRYDIVNYDIFDNYYPYYSPSAITVSEDGNVYIAGISYKGITDGIPEYGKSWYYTGGELVELEGSEEYSIRRVMLSGGRVYIFGTSRDNYYFVDGVKIFADVPDDSRVVYYTIAKGKLWMAGSDKQGACYWVDGKRHDLDGSAATTIFVEE